jgi:hypothetical protein
MNLIGFGSFGAQRQLFIGALLDIALTSVLCAQSGIGAISGVVAGEDGKPLVAIVTISRAGTFAWRGRAESKSDGSFSIANLPPGTYEFCAAVNGDVYLDPCNWSAKLPQVELVSGKNVDGYRLILQKGTTLTVRLNDPHQVLGATPLPGKVAPHVIVGIFTDRHLFHPLGVIAKDKQGESRQGSIPLGRNVSVYLRGKDVDLTDATGTSVDLDGATVAIQSALGSAQLLPVVFNVNPKKP